MLDQWTDQWRQDAKGDLILVRYADNAVIGFQDSHEGEQFVQDFRHPLSEHGLERNEEKTRLIRFGWFCAAI